MDKLFGALDARTRDHLQEMTRIRDIVRADLAWPRHSPRREFVDIQRRVAEAMRTGGAAGDARRNR